MHSKGNHKQDEKTTLRIFANKATDKGFISKIYKLLMPLNIKLLEENIGRTLYDINHSKILYDPPPREMEIKTKINIWDLMKLKSFYTAKETIKETKRQPSEWEKIFANEATDKGFNLQNLQGTHAA